MILTLVLILLFLVMIDFKKYERYERYNNVYVSVGCLCKDRDIYKGLPYPLPPNGWSSDIVWSQERNSYIWNKSSPATIYLDLMKNGQGFVVFNGGVYFFQTEIDPTTGTLRPYTITKTISLFHTSATASQIENIIFPGDVSVDDWLDNKVCVVMNEFLIDPTAVQVLSRM